jgi:hypothetical protein
MSRANNSSRTNGTSIGVVVGLLMAALGGGLASASSTDSASAATSSSAVNTATTTSAPDVLFSASFFPDPVLHPGAVDPTITSTILCAAGHTTRSVRPPTSYTTRLKQLELGDGGTIKAPNGKTYTVTGEHLPGSIADYELDHLISLELGGDPQDPKNLWMEPWERKGSKFAPAGRGAEGKDVVEGRLHREICKGTEPLTQAQTTIASNWTTAL